MRLIFCLLLTLCAAVAHAQTPASLYADDVSRPLNVRVASRQTLPQCRLERFSYEGANGLRVPALLFLPRSASKARPVPCLLALHGYGGGKETLAGWAFDAAQAGYATLAIDLWGQGERRAGHWIGSPTSQPQMDARQVQNDLIAGVPQTVRDARRGLDFLATRPEINKKRLGLLGFSLGAMVGTVAAGVDERIRAVVLVSGGGGWVDVLRPLARGERGLQDKNWDTLAATLLPEDPLSFAARIAPRPVFMVNGRRDTIILPAAAQHLYDAARAAPGSHVQIRWLPTGEHIPDTDVVYPLLRAWLRKNL